MLSFVQPLLTALAAVLLVALVGIVLVRLFRSRSSGLSIRMQVFLALASVVGLFAFVLGVVVLDRIKARADLVGHEAALGEARAAAALVGIEMETTGRTIEQVAARLKDSPRLSRRDDDSGPHLALLAPNGATLLASGRSPDEPGTVSATVPIEVDGAMVGQARVVKPTILIRKTLADFAPTVLIVSSILAAVAALFAVAIGSRIARPIESLTQFAERISQGERGAAPPPAFGREVQQLSRSLDLMRRELQGRRFVETFAADLSHELKNPVAAIRASAEVLRDGALEEPEEAARFVARILEATSRIEALLGDLLSLARLEARGVEHAERVDLDEVARELLAAQHGHAEHALRLEFAGSGTRVVRGDAAWIFRALANLVDNARVHGDAGPIVLRIAREGALVRCSVTNPGRVAPGLHDRLFRRFVTTRADRGGTGLGLAIVRAIAEAHGGDAICTGFGPSEVSFDVTLPAA